MWQLCVMYVTSKTGLFMKRIVCALAAVIALLPSVIRAQERPQSVGLVLSGGGAKGIAHIGVIKALEENDIPIDYVTGTSMGAIVGGLYAAGYTPDEMLDLILSKGFTYWSTGQMDPSLQYYFTKEEPSPAMLSVPIASKRDSLRADSTAVPASLISPLPMSYAFMQLFAAYNAQCGSDFNNLFVPYRCCASDVDAHRRVVLDRGDFGDAIRSSMSFPIVFQPTEFEGMLLYDGGIYDNFPVDVMNTDFAPDFILGSDVSTVETGPQTSLMDQIENLVIQRSDYYLDPETGIKIRFDLNEFSLLDFQQANAIYKIGYDKTMQMIDSIKGRVHTRVPKEYRELRRAAFKAKTPYVRFDKVDVSGGTKAQNRYITDMFTSNVADTFGIPHATEAYYRAVSTGKLNDLQPHAIYNDSTGLFALKLKASVKDDFKVGVGGYITSSTASYVYLSAGYSTFSYNSLAAKVSAWIGQSYLAAMLNARMFLPSATASALDLQAVVSRRKYFHGDNMIFDDDNPSFVRANEAFARLKWSKAAGQLAKFETGLGVGRVSDSFYMPINPDDYYPFRDHCHFNLGQVYASYKSSTLSDVNYPVSGRYYDFTAMGVLGSYKQKSGKDGAEADRSDQSWLQLESVTRNYFQPSRHFSLGVESDVMLSTRKVLKYYNPSIVTAPSYNPTPASNNSFNPAFRANSFVAAGVVPVYRYNDNISARLSLNGFVPVRKIVDKGNGLAGCSSRWFTDPQFYGELSLCYSLPFATVSAYGSYASSPGHDWNVGITFGVYLLAPKFLR